MCLPIDLSALLLLSLIRTSARSRSPQIHCSSLQLLIFSFRQNCGHREGAQGDRIKDKASGQVWDLPSSFSIKESEEEELKIEICFERPIFKNNRVFFYICIFSAAAFLKRNCFFQQLIPIGRVKSSTLCFSVMRSVIALTLWTRFLIFQLLLAFLFLFFIESWDFFLLTGTVILPFKRMFFHMADIFGRQLLKKLLANK